MRNKAEPHHPLARYGQRAVRKRPQHDQITFLNLVELQRLRFYWNGEGNPEAQRPPRILPNVQIAPTRNERLQGLAMQAEHVVVLMTIFRRHLPISSPLMRPRLDLHHLTEPIAGEFVVSQVQMRRDWFGIGIQVDPHQSIPGGHGELRKPALPTVEV
ncbi:Uncharacterised protein [Mycobacterium tuberculosis]|nr:Uncharacterised protein [Mycobacterium tuberculosis]COX03379.1 Uncharacterised protein [Mycobacterium tuberculosis]COX71078.1 Uncharacterised protein [Mycobacterium tuberculosis]